MCPDTSHLHGGCFVSLLTMDSAAAGLSTSMATIPHRHRVFEIVPRLRDRLAVCFVTPTTFTNPEHGMAGRRSTACCVACSTPLTTWSILAGLRLPCLANLSDTTLCQIAWSVKPEWAAGRDKPDSDLGCPSKSLSFGPLQKRHLFR